MVEAARQPGESPKAACIREAAKTVFLRDGYERTSMDVVAREAAVSKATVYAHFASKERLFVAMIDGECQKYALGFAAIESENLPVAEALVRIGVDFAQALTTPQAVALQRLVVGESHRFPELGDALFAAGFDQVQSMLSQFLGRAAARGDLRIDDPALAAELFLSMVKGHDALRALLGLDRRQPADIKRLVQAAVTLFVAGYAPIS